MDLCIVRKFLENDYNSESQEWVTKHTSAGGAEDGVVIRKEKGLYSEAMKTPIPAPEGTVEEITIEQRIKEIVPEIVSSVSTGITTH